MDQTDQRTSTSMFSLDDMVLTKPVRIVRILEVIFTCITFSLVASVGYTTDAFWTWCMFSWCFCFCVTILILILEFTGLALKLPLSWVDFTSAFSMFAALMMSVSSIIYGVQFIYIIGSISITNIAACIFSCLSYILYLEEFKIIRKTSGETVGFFATVPGLLKVYETFGPCIIFICLSYMYSWVILFPGLQWCVAVYSICFIFSFLVNILTICRLLTIFPVPFHKVLTVCNVVAVLMYSTAVIIWPVYSFKDNPSLPHCPGVECRRDLLVVITLMTCFNLLAYIIDMICSFKLICITTES